MKNTIKKQEEYEVKDLKKEMIKCYTEMGKLLSDLFDRFEEVIKLKEKGK